MYVCMYVQNRDDNVYDESKSARYHVGQSLNVVRFRLRVYGCYSEFHADAIFRQLKQRRFILMTEQTRSIRNLLYGFWLLSSSLLTKLCVHELAAQVYLFVFTYYFGGFASIHLVFCLKLSLGIFNVFFIACCCHKSFVKHTWIWFVYLQINSENFPPKLAALYGETYCTAKQPITMRHFACRPASELSHIINVCIYSVKKTCLTNSSKRLHQTTRDKRF